jgi:hypothetical protein
MPFLNLGNGWKAEAESVFSRCMIGFRQPDNRERAWLMTIPGIALYLGLENVMQEERAFLIGLSFYVFYTIIDQMWDRRRDRWFWISLGAFGAIHLLALSIVTVPHIQGPAMAVAFPFMFLDGFAMWAILKWIEQRVSKRPV